MFTEKLLERLVEGVTLRSADAGIRFTTVYDPSGGPGSRVMPPSYPGGYVRSKRHVGREEPVDTVLIDSFQSQANRIEAALLDARDDGRIKLPLFELDMRVDDWPVRLTSLDMPHRYADAYLRDSLLDDTKFDKSEPGKALRVATPENAGALYRYDPGSLAFGAWNSHRKGRQPKFARAYKSEVLGIDEVAATRKGGRLDPFNLTGAITMKADGNWEHIVSGEKKKGERLSEIGHGNALSGEEALGGVTVDEVRRVGFLSFAALARLKFPEVAGARRTEAHGFARAAVAALALAGDRLAFGGAGVVFRSGCELTVREDRLDWEMKGAKLDALDLDVDGALELFARAVERAADAGLPMSAETYSLEPIPGLRKAIEHAFLAAATEEG